VLSFFVRVWEGFGAYLGQANFAQTRICFSTDSFVLLLQTDPNSMFKEYGTVGSFFEFE